MKDSQLNGICAALLDTISQAHGLYHRLVLVVGPAGTGKTTLLQLLSHRFGVPVVNLSQELSRRLLELTERQRVLAVRALLAGILEDAGVQSSASVASTGQGSTGQTTARHTSTQPDTVILLDNIELLFDPALKQDPLRLLEAMSRNKTLVVSWPGCAGEGRLSYAVPGHPEHRCYRDADALIFSVRTMCYE